MATSDYQEFLFKVIVIGDSGTGKSSLIQRYVHNIFSSVHKATVGVDFALKATQTEDKKLVSVQYWDIAGQERYRNMCRVYYRDAVAAMIVFDVTSNESFEAVEKWKADVDEKVFLSDGSPVPCLLVANKIDLRNDVNMNEIADYAKNNGYIGLVETSAATKQNVELAFRTVTEYVMKDPRNVIQRDDVVDHPGPLPQTAPVRQSSSCCGGAVSKHES